jgi:ElaB/YqjD/DUF883 family membrane-anchored ribosome-binding protein
MENKIKRPRFIQMEKIENDNMMMVDSTDQLLDSNNNNSDKQKSTLTRKIVSTWEEFFEDPINNELQSNLIDNFIEV